MSHSVTKMLLGLEKKPKTTQSCCIAAKSCVVQLALRTVLTYRADGLVVCNWKTI